MSKSKNEPKSKSASFCQQPHRDDPSKPCGGVVLAKERCRYHYDKLRLGQIRGTPEVPLYRKGAVQIGAIPALMPAEKRVFDLHQQKSGLSIYRFASQILEEWARSQPEYVDFETVTKRAAPELVELANLAKTLKPSCKCGECVPCKARALLKQAATGG